MIAALVVIVGFFAAGNPTLAQAGTYAAIYACAAIGLSILLGNTAQISLGQAGFFGIGAYSVGYFTGVLNWPFWPAALLGVALATGAGLAVGFIALRFRGHYLAMATLAFGLIVVGIFHESPLLGGAIGIQSVPSAHAFGVPITGITAYWLTWVMALAAAGLSLNLLRGRTGRAFEAIRNDELAAEIAGVPTRRYKIFAFAYSGALAGAAGAMYAAFLGLVVPEAVSVPLSVSILLMVVLGGSGGVSGALLGAALIGVLDVAGHQYENWREVAYGALVILVVIAAPGGIAGFIRARMVRGSSGSPPTSSPPFEKIASVSSRHPDSANQTERVEGRPHDKTPPLTVTHVTKRFGGLVAVDDVSFTLERGTLTSLIGPNGAGKTTLFNAICGIGRVSGGSVTIGGTDVTGRQPHEIVGLGVGRTFQNARLFAEMTVLENVVAGAFRTERASFAADLFGLPSSRRAEREATERAHATLARLGLEHIAGTFAKDLAFGDRRRVELARAIAADPWLLLVDEPAAGLNHAERGQLHEDLLALRDAGTTLLLIEHDMRLVMSISDRVMVLKFGAMIADGDTVSVRNDPGVIAAYLGTAN